MIAISKKYEILAASLSGGKITVILYDIVGGIEREISLYFKKEEAEQVFKKFCEERNLLLV